MICIIAEIAFPGYYDDHKYDSYELYLLGIAGVLISGVSVVGFIVRMRHDGIYLSTDGVRVLRRAHTPMLVESVGVGNYMNPDIDQRYRRMEKKKHPLDRHPTNRFIHSPEFAVMPTEDARRGQWCIAFLSATQVVERVPMQWIGVDSEAAAFSVIGQIKSAQAKLRRERPTTAGFQASDAAILSGADNRARS